MVIHFTVKQHYNKMYLDQGLVRRGGARHQGQARPPTVRRRPRSGKLVHSNENNNKIEIFEGL